MENVAKYGIIVDNTGAARPIQATIDQLKALANGGREATATLKGLSGGMTQAGAQAEAAARRAGTLTDSILRMKRASAEKLDLGLASQIEKLDPFQRKLDATTQSAGGAKLSLGRLGQQFGNLAGSIAGTNPIVGNLLSVMGSFAVGSAFTVGVLGGLALIAVAYDKITEGARKARLENEGLTRSLADQFAPKTGPDSETALRYAGALRQQADALQRLKLLQGSGNDFTVAAAFRAAGLAAPTRSRDIEIDSETERLRLANRALGRARAGGAGILETVTATDPYDRARVENDRVAKDKFDAEARSRAFELAGRQEGYKRDARQLNLVPDSAVKSLDSLLTPAMIRAADAAERFENSLDAAKQKAEDGFAAWGLTSTIGKNGKPKLSFDKSVIGKEAGAGAAGAVGDALAQFSPQALTFKAVSTGLNYIINGFADMALGMFDGGAAAQAYAREQRRLNLEYQSGMAAFKKDDLGAELTNIALAADQLRDSLRQAKPLLETLLSEGGDGLRRLKAEQDAIDAQEKRNTEAARRKAANDEKYGLEDLDIRNLRATGRGDEADRLAKQREQEREYTAAQEKAMADGVITLSEQTYLNTLQTTQNNELLAFQNGLLSTAIRNSPTGGYGIEGYLGRFATPVGPPGWPTDSGPGRGPDNPRGGVPLLGGGQTRPGLGTINIPIMLDGKQIMKTIVINLDEVAASTGGAGSSRAAAWDFVRR